MEDNPGRRFPPRRHSLRDQVLSGLRTDLLTGEMRPGEVYSAPALAARFGVSPTPVREAMQQLVREGVVEVIANRGFRVIPRTCEELADLAEIRALLEVPVLLRLAHTVPPERWAELRPLAQATVAAAATRDPAGYVETHLRFHCALLALSGNRQLVAVTAELYRRSQASLIGEGGALGSTTALGGRGDLVAEATEHTALIDALVSGEPTTVERLIRSHFPGVAEG